MIYYVKNRKKFQELLEMLSHSENISPKELETYLGLEEEFSNSPVTIEELSYQFDDFPAIVQAEQEAIILFPERKISDFSITPQMWNEVLNGELSVETTKFFLKREGEFRLNTSIQNLETKQDEGNGFLNSKWFLDNIDKGKFNYCKWNNIGGCWGLGLTYQNRFYLGFLSGNPMLFI